MRILLYGVVGIAVIPFLLIAGFLFGAVIAVPMILILFPATLLSLPFIVIAFGAMVLGDDKRCDWWMEHSPIMLCLDFMDRHL